MALLVISLIAGVLTIISPCVLPLLPVIVGGSLTSTHKTRPYIIAAALLASLVIFTILLKISTLLISVPPQIWELISGSIIILFGLITLFPGMWERVSVRLASHSDSWLHAAAKKNNWVGSIFIGLALGPVFSSCSPTYALLLATVLPQNLAQGLVYIITYSIGLSVALLLVALLGQKLIKKLRWAADPRGWFKRILGVLFILVGLLIVSGYEKKLEAGLLNSGAYNSIALFEINLIESTDQYRTISSTSSNSSSSAQVVDEYSEALGLSIAEPFAAPELTGIEQWINSDGELLADLQGKVVLIDFWTYSCINCIRTLPYITEWYNTYEDDGLVVLGIHAPEFQFERELVNVQQAVEEYNIRYPVGLDNDFGTWRAYSNRYWPAKYFIDRQGNLRHYHFGEGEYTESEAIIRYLLEEDGTTISDGISDDMNESANDIPPITNLQSPETYIGYSRSEQFLNEDERVNNENTSYTSATDLPLHHWTIGGDWIITDEAGETQNFNAVLRYNFSAKDVYLVMGAQNSSLVTIRLNGEPVTSAGAGSDVQDSTVSVQQSDLYHLISLPEFADNQTLELEFPAGVTLNAFTFGS